MYLLFLRKTVIGPGDALCAVLLLSLRWALFGERWSVTQWVEGLESLMVVHCLLAQGASGVFLCLEGATPVPCPIWRRGDLSRMTGQPRSPVCDQPKHSEQCLLQQGQSSVWYKWLLEGWAFFFAFILSIEHFCIPFSTFNFFLRSHNFLRGWILCQCFWFFFF